MRQSREWEGALKALGENEPQHSTLRALGENALEHNTRDPQTRPRALSKTSFATTKRSPNRKVGIQDFEFEKMIGRGGFGKVWLASKRSSGTKFAIKVQDKKHILDKGSVERTIAERELMQSMSHSGLVRLAYSFQDVVNVYLVMSYCPCGTLHDLLKAQPKRENGNRAFCEEGAHFYSSCLVLALEYLHTNGIVHRDLKPENILIDVNGYPKLTDLGMAKRIGFEHTHSVVGTPEYMAPEIISENGHSFAVDWWALGCLTYEMVVGVSPFYAESTKDLFVNILTGNTRPFSDELRVSHATVRFVESLLVVPSLHRLGSSAEDGCVGTQNVKTHPFMSNTCWNSLLEEKIECPPSVVRPRNFPGHCDSPAEDPFKEFSDFSKFADTPRRNITAQGLGVRTPFVRRKHSRVLII